MTKYCREASFNYFSVLIAWLRGNIADCQTNLITNFGCPTQSLLLMQCLSFRLEITTSMSFFIVNKNYRKNESLPASDVVEVSKTVTAFYKHKVNR